MRISICSKSRVKPSSDYPIENLGFLAQVFFMSPPNTPLSRPEILTPAMQLRLQALEAQHEAEAIQLERLEALARLMDARFHLPILPIPIGLDTIIGLIPGIGDTISLGISGVIVAGSRKLNVSAASLMQMGANIFVDWLIGLVPIIFLILAGRGICAMSDWRALIWRHAGRRNAKRS